MIDVSCLCGKKFRAKPEVAGRQVKCPACGQSFVVPAPNASGASDDPFVVDLSNYEESQAAGDPQVPVSQQPIMQQPAGFGGYQTPAALRKPGNKKTRFYITLGVGGLVGIGAVIGVIMLIMSLAVGPHERLMKRTIGLMEDYAAALESINDVASANAALKKIEKLTNELQDIQKEASQLEKLSDKEQERLKEKYKPQQDAITERMKSAVFALASKPQLLRQIGSSVGRGLRIPGNLRMPRNASPPRMPGGGGIF